MAEWGLLEWGTFQWSTAPSMEALLLQATVGGAISFKGPRLTQSNTTGTLPHGQYFYVVSVVDGDGNSVTSPYAGIVVSAPNDTVTVEWEEITGADHYIVFRVPASGVSASATGFTVSDATTVTFVDVGDDGDVSEPPETTEAGRGITAAILVYNDDTEIPVQLPVCIESGQLNITFRDGFLQDEDVTFSFKDTDSFLYSTEGQEALERGTYIRLVGQIQGDNGIVNVPYGRYRIVDPPDIDRDPEIGVKPMVTIKAQNWLRGHISNSFVNFTAVDVSGFAGDIATPLFVADAMLANDPDGVTAAEAQFTFEDAPDTNWWQTWIGCIWAVFYYLTDSSVGNVRINLDAQLSDLTHVAHNLIPYTESYNITDRFGNVIPQSIDRPRWWPYRNLPIQPTTTYYDLLRQRAGIPDPTTIQFQLWEPAVISFDGDGVMQWRKYTSRWTQGWGFSYDLAANPVTLPMAVKKYSGRPEVPEFDSVSVWMPGSPPASYIPPPGHNANEVYWPPVLIGHALAGSRWYTPVTDLTRDQPLMLGITPTFGPDITAYYTELYNSANNMARAALAHYMSRAFRLTIPLAHAFLFPELGQEIAMHDLPYTEGGFFLTSASVSFDANDYTMTVSWRHD